MLAAPNRTQTLPQRVGDRGAPHWVLAGLVQSCSCPPLKGDTRNSAAPQGWIFLGAVLGIQRDGIWVGFPCEMS